MRKRWLRWNRQRAGVALATVHPSWHIVTETVLTFRHRIVVGEQMDLTGRFDFWRMLLNTRAITPPRAVTRPRWQIAKLLMSGWLVIPVILVLSIGVAVYLRNLPAKSVVVGQATTVTYPTRGAQPW